MEVKKVATGRGFSTRILKLLAMMDQEKAMEFHRICKNYNDEKLKFFILDDWNIYIELPEKDESFTIAYVFKVKGGY